MYVSFKKLNTRMIRFVAYAKIQLIQTYVHLPVYPVQV